MRVDCYARVSSQEQDVDQQMKYLFEYCKKNDYQISSAVYDKQSASVPLEQRKKFMQLLNNKKGDAMLVFNLDRLTRNWDSVTFIEKHFRENWEKYKLISTKDDINLNSASGRAMFRMKMIMTCYMPEDMLEKQEIGIARAKAEGKFKGRKKGALAKQKYPANLQNNNGIHLQHRSIFYYGWFSDIKSQFKQVFAYLSSKRREDTFN